MKLLVWSIPGTILSLSLNGNLLTSIEAVENFTVVPLNTQVSEGDILILTATGKRNYIPYRQIVTVTNQIPDLSADSLIISDSGKPEHHGEEG